MNDTLADLGEKIANDQPLTGDEARRIAECPDLPSIGLLGETVRKAKHGDRVTFVRVSEVAAGVAPPDRGEAGEVRLTGVPGSIEQAVSWVHAGVRHAQGVPVTGFSLADLVRLVNG